MKPLSDVQAAFAGALRDPALAVPGAVSRPPGMSRTRRFDVYRNNVVVSLIEALEATYPAVSTLVGDEFFRACARVFIDAEPPRSPVLLCYGGGFGDFIDRFEPARSVPYLGDVARLEWARLEAYHAADENPAAIAVLGAIDRDAVDSVTFRFHPSFSLVRSRWPVVSLWSASTGGMASSEVDMSRPQDALVVRPALEVDTRIAPDCSYVFITALLAGKTLGAATIAASEADDRFDLASHLAGLFAIGAIAAVTLP